jgi:hypothetical protein
MPVAEIHIGRSTALLRWLKRLRDDGPQVPDNGRTWHAARDAGLTDAWVYHRVRKRWMTLSRAREFEGDNWPNVIDSGHCVLETLTPLGRKALRAHLKPRRKSAI